MLQRISAVYCTLVQLGGYPAKLAGKWRDTYHFRIFSSHYVPNYMCSDINSLGSLFLYVSTYNAKYFFP